MVDPRLLVSAILTVLTMAVCTLAAMLHDARQKAEMDQRRIEAMHQSVKEIYERVQVYQRRFNVAHNALEAIIERPTPRANATVKAMAKIAHDALTELFGG